MAAKSVFMQNGFNIKEIDMKNIMETIFDRVFSFTTMMGLLVLLTGWFLGSAIINENEERALNKATIKACYDGGLIKVDTDAGSYCVAPSNLDKVEVK